MSIPVLLVSLILAPYPKLVLGTWLGRWVEIGQALAKIFVFMVCVDVTRVHPQFDTLEYVTSEMRAASSSLTTADARLEKVINLVDDYGWNRGFLINVGDVKGQVLDQALRARRRDPQPLQLAVELGTFVGYGTLRMARVLNGSSTLITVDPSVMSYAIASSLYEQAGVRDQITMKKDFSYNTFRELKQQGKKIDALFIDHVKKFYLSDLKLALQLDLLAQNCVVVADNILSPGAPDYKSFMFSEEGRQLFKTEVHQLHVEYMPTWPDEVLVSTFLGGS